MNQEERTTKLKSLSKYLSSNHKTLEELFEYGLFFIRRDNEPLYESLLSDSYENLVSIYNVREFDTELFIQFEKFVTENLLVIYEAISFHIKNNSELFRKVIKRKNLKYYKRFDLLFQCCRETCFALNVEKLTADNVQHFFTRFTATINTFEVNGSVINVEIPIDGSMNISEEMLDKISPKKKLWTQSKIALARYAHDLFETDTKFPSFTRACEYVCEIYVVDHGKPLNPYNLRKQFYNK